jgi:hypothetical protein
VNLPSWYGFFLSFSGCVLAPIYVWFFVPYSYEAEKSNFDAKLSKDRDVFPLLATCASPGGGE